MNRKTRKAIDDTIVELIKDYWGKGWHEWDTDTCQMCLVFAKDREIFYNCGDCPLATKGEHGGCEVMGRRMFGKSYKEGDFDISLYIGALEGLKHQPQALEE